LLVKHNLNTNSRQSLSIPRDQIQTEVTRIQQDMQSQPKSVLEFRQLNAYISQQQARMALAKGEVQSKSAVDFDILQQVHRQYESADSL
jgi:hypothetical protein